MKPLLLLFLFLITSPKVYASNIDEMYTEFRNYINHEAAVILLAQAHIESNCGKKGIAKRNGLNWWNITSVRGVVRYEYENGRLVKKRWKVWKTKRRAAREVIFYLKRKHPGALTFASNDDIKSYVKTIKKGGYFTGSEERYRKSLRQARKYIQKIVG